MGSISYIWDSGATWQHSPFVDSGNYPILQKDSPDSRVDIKLDIEMAKKYKNKSVQDNLR